MAIYRMINRVQPYAWGSTTMLARIQRRPPSTTPEAELWMGTHPSAPSALETASGEMRPLRDHLREIAGKTAPGANLTGDEPGGARTGNLPFLFKVLTAERGLSIQVHPDMEQARAGFDREEAAGIPRDASHRNYRDGNHKPELVCAITEFHGLCGFRPDAELHSEMHSLLELLRCPGEDCPSLEPLCGAIDTYLATAGTDTWRNVYLALLQAGNTEAGRQTLVERGATYVCTRQEEHPRYRWCVTLLEQYPGDPGALAPLYLNLFKLNPGEALYLGPGILHAYLHGAAVEVMASSDNVLRAGCTVKHIDAQELAGILRFDRLPLALAPRTERLGLTAYSTPAAEFELLHLTREGAITRKGGPAIVINLGDPVSCVDPAGGAPPLQLAPGESLFIDQQTDRVDLRSVVPGGVVSLYVAAMPGTVSGGVTIWVDGDSCPAAVREILMRTAERRGVAVVFCANRVLPVRRSVTMRVVTETSVDEYILETLSAASSAARGNLVVTRDIPLAEKLVERGIPVMNDRGRLFELDSVRELRSLRDAAAAIRAQGLESMRAAVTYGHREQKAFADALDRFLARAFRSGDPHR